MSDLVGSVTTAVAPQRHRWLFFFTIEGDLRFISHHDTLRLFRRALARADLPVRFSEGFNPHPRLSLPLPRPVGVASDSEALVVEFEQPIDGQDAIRRLAEHVPQGIRLQEAQRVAPGQSFAPAAVRYRLEWEEDHGPDVQEKVRSILQAETLEIERTHTKNGRPRKIDVRPYLIDVQIRERGIEFTAKVTGEGSVRPAEVIALLGLNAESMNHQIRRLEVRWNQT